MATIRQKTALRKLVENGGNVTAAMRDAKYSEATINSPQNLTESKGYKQLLKEYGLTEELIIGSLVEDIKAKPQKRYSELTLGAELLRLKNSGDGGGNTYNTVVIAGDQAARIARRIVSRTERGEEGLDIIPDSNEPTV